MSNDDVIYSDLEEAREALVRAISHALTDSDKEFLMAFNEGKLFWDKLGLKDLSYLPGIKWKQMNIAKIDKNKKYEQLKKLEQVF